ncbi:MAG TPA: deoxyhypusine synthase family protein [Polyangia bacterium]|nr:deoxyhypusine synthase family protein [Polyangia bacterium]
MRPSGPITAFIDHHFRHFNARETVAAARAWNAHLAGGGKMLVAMAGAMSTAEIGIVLSRMIREDKVHAISCTAANLEEDIFNLVAHDEYEVLPHYLDLSPEAELDLRDRGFNRVTDTAIPETVFRHLEREFMEECRLAHAAGERYFAFEIFKKILLDGRLEQYYQIPRENSWLLAACEKGIPVYSPGFEDSTLGNIFTARVIEGTVPSHQVLRSGTEQMEHLVDWYCRTDEHHSIGFFQIGGGIAGDFAICAVPLILQDLERDRRHWGYFCQISDSTTSYGSYSGAVPNEKITWFKLGIDTPKFMINSDASIVAPLIFAYVLGD